MTQDGTARDDVDWPALLGRLYEYGMTQEEIARAVGAVSKGGEANRITVRRWERGINKPTGPYRKALLDLEAERSGRHRFQ